MRSLLRLLLAAVAVGGLAACEVRVRVGVDAEVDGSGRLTATVVLDEAAARQAGDLAGQLRVDDLRRAGWRVGAPARTPSGGLRIEASRPFARPEELAAAAEQLSGPGGPFRDFRLTTDRSFARTTTSFSGVVDLSGGLEAFADERLAEQAGGAPFGAPAADLERRLGVVLNRVFRVQVAAALPGAVESNAPSVGAAGAVWAPRLGEQVRLTATSATWHTTRLVLVGAALLAALLAVAAAVGARRRRRRPVGPATPV